ncbi:MAG: hypothetical protein NVSMB32_10350 [Actinomycetota bacterium]
MLPPANVRALVATVALTVLFVLLGLGVVVGEFHALDRVLFAQIQAATNDSVERLMTGVSWLGSVEVTVPVLALACLVGRSRRRITDPRVWAPMAVLAVLVVAEVVCKHLLHQVPPSAGPGGDYELLGLRLPFTFPSGHVMRFTMVVGLVGIRLHPGCLQPGRRQRWFWAGSVGAALLLGLARVSSGGHWPTDVVGGLLLGAAGVAAVVALDPPDQPAADLPAPSPVQIN